MANGCAEEFRRLINTRRYQKAPIRAPLNGKFIHTGVFFLQEMLSRILKIIKTILFFSKTCRIMPVIPIFPLKRIQQIINKIPEKKLQLLPASSDIGKSVNSVKIINEH